MDSNAILQKIIDENGNCCWSNMSICLKCPLSRLERYDSGNYMSCVEALNIDGLSEEEADLRYKAAAISKLADLAINNMIESE